MKTLVESLNEALGKKYYEDILKYFKTMIYKTSSNKPLVRFFVNTSGSMTNDILRSIEDTIDKLILGMNTVLSPDKSGKEIKWEMYGYEYGEVEKIDKIPNAHDAGNSNFGDILLNINNIKPFGKENDEIVNVFFTNYIPLSSDPKKPSSRIPGLLQKAGRYNVIVVDEYYADDINEYKLLDNIEQKTNNVLIVRAQY